jgi:hypothetical protein
VLINSILGRAQLKHPNGFNDFYDVPHVDVTFSL